MKKILFIICVAFISGGADGATEACVRTAYNVKYTCGDGTLIGVLPDDAAAEYGKTFYGVAINGSMCEPPEGYELSGTALYIENVESAWFSGSVSFVYNYTMDAELRAYYVAKPEAKIASVYDVVANDKGGTASYPGDQTTGEWQIVFPYGVVKGVSRCSSIKEPEIEVAMIPLNQDAIENDQAGGSYCYCKMTEPYVVDNPWILRTGGGCSVYDCAVSCASRISDINAGRPWRLSLFSAAVKQVTEQVQQQ